MRALRRVSLAAIVASGVLSAALACGPMLEPRGAAASAPRATESERRPVPQCAGLRDGGLDAETDATDDGAGALDASAAPPIEDADEVVALLRPAMRRCYEDALRHNPALTGCTVMGARVGPDGTVLSIGPLIARELTPELVECLGEVLRGARFTPTGRSSSLQIPIWFVVKGR